MADLGDLLTEHASGRRVLVVGRGAEAQVDALTRAGFFATALDLSEPSVGGERRGARRTRADVLTDHERLQNGVTGADAAVCLDPDGDRDADQRRLFACLRHHLREQGALVVVHTAPSHGRPHRYVPLTGRLHEDPTILHPTKLVSLIRASGFAVEATIDIPSRHGPLGTAIVVIARALPVPPRSLALTSWAEPAEGTRLDLRYADDEAEWLDPSPAAVWSSVVASTADRGASLVAHYPVDDPFGSHRGAPLVSRHFRCAIGPHQLTFAAGVTSLLHDLADLADGGPILAPALVHPDLEAWALARGCVVRHVPEPATLQRLREALEQQRPSLLHVDRPSFTADLLSLDEIASLTRAASTVGAIVVVDESAAPYLRPEGSCARLVPQLDRLVVLRGFTKAYSWGGLRGAFAIASNDVAQRVQELIVPMQVGELALQAALHLLAEGDVFDRLRARVRAVKPAFVQRLRAEGLQVTPGHEDIPWVVVADHDGLVTSFLGQRGIRGLLPTPAPLSTPPEVGWLHLTVPLSRRRIALFQQLMSANPTASEQLA